MAETTKSQIAAVELSAAQHMLAELIRRSAAGEEIILTDGGKPVAMLASPENIQILANVGAISYELPFAMGGYGWFGPRDEEAKQRADEVYEEQFEP